MYIHETDTWPNFTWDRGRIDPKLASVNKATGYLEGILSSIGIDIKERAAVEAYTHDIVASSEIEGLQLNPDQVRSSLARRMGVQITGEVPYGHYVEGIVQMMMDAVQGYDDPLTEDRLFGWHCAIFPNGRNGYEEINVGRYRVDEMNVISGALGREKVHYRAPAPERVPEEMDKFLKWFNDTTTPSDYVKSAIAHFWFVCIHPFDDGNGRLTRTLTDMLLARADGTPQRFYSMSAAILRDRKNYYDVLEYMGKHGLDITQWLLWFLQTMESAIDTAVEKTHRVVRKSLFWQEHCNAALNERQIKVINLLWDGFEGKLNTSKWAKMTKTSTATALRDIQDLVEKGILRCSNEGGRSTNYELIEE